MRYSNYMLQEALSRKRYLALFSAGLIVLTILLSSFQHCVAESDFIQFLPPHASLTQPIGNLLEESDCSQLQIGIDGILPSLISGYHFLPKKDSFLPFLFLLLALFPSGIVGHRFLLPVFPESRFFYKNSILFKLSEVRLLI